MQNIIIALLVMIVIALLLIPQPLCAFWVALACASIDFGVIGYMTLWGVNLVSSLRKQYLGVFEKENSLKVIFRN